MPEPELIYLDNAATTWPKPDELPAAMADYVRAPAGNAGRGNHAGALKAGKVLDRVRASLSELVGASDPSRIVLTSGATEGINTAIHGIINKAAREGRAPVRVVAGHVEHNAVVRPLDIHLKRNEAELVRIGVDDRGRVRADELIDAVNENTALVITSAASNATGILQPIDEIGPRLRERNEDTLLLVDGAQSVGAAPMNVREWCVDLLAVAGHKSLLGPTGVGALYVSDRVYDPATNTDRMEGFRQGGTGSDAPNPAMPDAMPKHYEAGTLNTVGFAGLLASLEALDGKRESILAHERALISRVIEALKDDPRIVMAYPHNMDRTGVLSFAVPDADAHEIATVLDQSFSIAVRAGLQCAPWAHESIDTLNSGGLVRVSPGWKSTEQDIDRFLNALAQVLDELVATPSKRPG